MAEYAPVRVTDASVRGCVMYANLQLRGEDARAIGTRLTVEISEAYDAWLEAHDRTERAAALREAAEELDALYFGPDQATPFTTGAKHKWGAIQSAKRIRERADRIERGDGG